MFVEFLLEGEVVDQIFVVSVVHVDLGILVFGLVGVARLSLGDDHVSEEVVSQVSVGGGPSEELDDEGGVLLLDELSQNISSVVLAHDVGSESRDVG